jgi:hypothetical protein
MPSNEHYDTVVGTLFADNSIASILRASENCFIRQYLSDFAYASRNIFNERGWNSFLCLFDPEPSALPSKIKTGGYPYSNFRRIRNVEKANIMPKVRFHKVIVDANTKKPVREIPIQFPDSNKENIVSLLSNKDERGDDIGIKEFTFDIKNQNPFAASRVVESTLVLTMLSGESLTKTRPSGFRFADLIIRNNRVDPDSFDSDFYQIKATVGYEIPDGDAISAGLKNDLKQIQMSMIMTLIDYDINFEQNGFLTLTLNYVSRIEQQFESANKYNLFEDKEFEKGEAGRRATLRSGIRKQKGNRALASRDLEYAINAAQARHTQDVMAIPKVGEIVYSAGVNTIITPGGAAGGAGTYIQDEESRYEELLRASDRRDQAIAAARQAHGNALSAADAAIDSLNADLAYAQNQNRVEKYSQMLDRLFDFGKVRKVVIPKDALLIYGQTFQDELNSYVQELVEAGTSVLEVQRLLTFISTRRGNISVDIADQITNSTPIIASAVPALTTALDDLAKQIAVARGGAGTAVTVEDILNANRQFDPREFVEAFVSATPVSSNVFEGSLADSSQPHREHKVIYYFYLGDLIEQALAINFTTQKFFDDTLALCFGNFEYSQITPTLSTTAAHAGSASPYEMLETNHTMNIADFPITLEMFMRFFKENISNKSLDVYPVSNFLRDAMQRLVMPSLNSECFGNAIDDPKTVKTVSFELPETKRKSAKAATAWRRAGLTNEPISLGAYGNVTVTSLANYYQNVFGTPPGSMRRDINQLMLNNPTGTTVFGNNDRLSRRPAKERYGYYLTYISSRSRELRFMGDEQKDATRGIYHFYIGSDRGLVKNIDFVKQSDSQIALIMAERAMTKGDEKIELWRNFAARLTLIGNVLLAPGSFIYINPTISGLGNPKSNTSLGRAMGLGGYYMVLRVSNTISESGWTTNVEAVWQSVPPNTPLPRPTPPSTPTTISSTTRLSAGGGAGGGAGGAGGGAGGAGGGAGGGGGGP